MGTMNLPEGSRVYLDTNSLIYTVESIQPYSDALVPLWEQISRGSVTAISSEPTLLEVLVHPTRSGNKELEQKYRRLLVSHVVELLPINRDVIETAIHIRATTKLKIPDAVHLATFSMAQANFLVTNDHAMATAAGDGRSITFTK